MNPYVSYDTPLHQLMYTTNQLADHFASRSVAGDDIFNPIYSGVQQYFPYGITPTTIVQYSAATVPSLTTIRDATFPHAIRAIAGLFYWFAKEADILPKPLTYVYLSGTYTLYQGGTGYWYTQLGNGIEPFTYNWQIMYLDGSGYLQSYESVKKEKEKREKDKNKQKDGDIIIEAAPSNEWVPIGTNSPTFSKPHNPYDLRDFKLRCIVKDASNTTKTSNEFYVDVTTDPPPMSSVISNNEIEQNISLAKENEFFTQPTSYSLAQNYPNPFNPTTKISYTLPEAGFVSLKVYDMLGRKITTLVNETKSVGRYEVEFNASELPSGIYLCVLNAGSYQSIRKMLLIK